MTTLIALLYIIGIILVLVEVIVPGGILGAIGAAFFIGGCGLAFFFQGIESGLIGLSISLVALGVALFIEFKLLPRTRVGRRAFLSAAVTGHSNEIPGGPELVGHTGEAVTALAPSGIVLIDGRKREAFSESGFIERGARVTVRNYDNFRLIVVKA